MMRVRARISWDLVKRTVKLLGDAQQITARSGLLNLSAELQRVADEWQPHMDKSKHFAAKTRTDLDFEEMMKSFVAMCERKSKHPDGQFLLSYRMIAAELRVDVGNAGVLMTLGINTGVVKQIVPPTGSRSGVYQFVPQNGRAIE